MLSTEENVAVLIEAWKFMAGGLPGAKIHQAGGVATMFGHVALPFLNLSVLDRPLADERDLRGVLAVARERAASCAHGSMLGLCEALAPADWERIAAEEGFVPALNMTGMAADRLLPPRRAPPDLEFRRVLHEAEARDLATINAHAYGMPLEQFECICNLYLWREDSFAYVGYAGGQAVTSAAVLPVPGAMYIAFVATLPEAYGKGYAEAVMRRAIEQAQPSMRVTRMTLHASDMGKPLYQSMGFEPGASVLLLAAPDAASRH